MITSATIGSYGTTIALEMDSSQVDYSTSAEAMLMAMAWECVACRHVSQRTAALRRVQEAMPSLNTTVLLLVVYCALVSLSLGKRGNCDPRPVAVRQSLGR